MSGKQLRPSGAADAGGGWTAAGALRPESLPDALVLVGADGRILEASPLAAGLFGVAPPDLRGLPIDALLRPCDGSTSAPASFVPPARAGSRVRCDALAVRPDGSWRWVDATGVRLEGGAAPAILALRDMTARVEAARAQEEARERLQQTCTELELTNVSLEETTCWAKEIAAQAMVSVSEKGQFLAQMSHEIRTPLSGLLSTLDLLREEDPTPAQLDLIGLAQRSGETLLELLNQVLDFSKIEANRLELESVSFRPAEVVEDALAILAARADSKELELVGDVRSDVPPWLRGDPVRLRQILLNLVGNAIKFTERGEVVVTLRCLGRATEAARLHLRVRDTGIGLTPAQQRRIFEPYRQAGAATTRKFGGTGLGLNIVKRLVEAMGGTIRLRSAPGRGTAFSVVVPFPIAAAPAGEPDAAAARPGLPPGASVLVVEHNPAARRAILRLLRAWRLEVWEAAGPDEARALLSRAGTVGPQPAAIALGVPAPNRAWTEEARSLVLDADAGGIPVLLVSGLTGVREARALPQIRHAASKPLRRDRLCQLLTDLAGASRATAGPPTSGPPPADPPTAGPPAAGKEERPGRGRPPDAGLALVVDDSPVNRLVASRLLGTLGFSVEEADDGEAALLRFRPGRYRLILMDRRMPGLDGMEVTRRIRRLENGSDAPRTPIVGVTGDTEAAALAECRAAGMDEVAVKPLRLADVRAIAARWSPPEQGRGEDDLAPDGAAEPDEDLRRSA